MKNLFKIVIGLVIVLALAWIIVLNIPKMSVENKAADFQLTAAELFQSFESNEQQATKTYSGKIIELAGEVMEIEKDQNDAYVFIIDGGDGFNAVMCTMDGSVDALSKVKAGDRIRVRGLCSGMNIDVVMNKCVLIE